MWDNIGTGPDQIDINWHLPLSMGYFARADWTHWNSVRYNAKTDQYAVNSRDFGEIYIIDRKTKKIVWRYGNPATHGMGKAPSGYHDDGDQVLFGSHDVEWLPNGNISIFNNGTHRPSANRSSVMEINPATNQVVWQYETKDHNSFYSDFQSAAQKLPNGNWFITSTNNGHLFEVTPDKQVVWEYNNPISTDDQAYCVKRDDNPETQVHRAYRYGKDFPAFAGKDLKPPGQARGRGAPTGTCSSNSGRAPTSARSNALLPRPSARKGPAPAFSPKPGLSRGTTPKKSPSQPAQSPEIPYHYRSHKKRGESPKEPPPKQWLSAC